MTYNYTDDKDDGTLATPTLDAVLDGNDAPRRLELSLWQKLATLNDVVGDYIQKDKRNTEQRYTYISEGKVLSKVKPALKEARLIAVPVFELLGNDDKTTKNGAVWKLATVRCTLSIYDIDSGDHVDTVALGQGTDSGDKAIAKAQTQAYKYAWWKLLCLETGDDPEADESTDAQQFGGTATPWGTLYGLWTRSGYTPAEMQPYMCRRFGHEVVTEVTEQEITTVISELQSQLRNKGMA